LKKEILAPPQTNEPTKPEEFSDKIEKRNSLRLGKDEMNLVEHPFAFLKRPKPGDEIFLAWEKKHPRTNKIMAASWRVSGDAKLGLPGPVEERLYLVLMELSREQGWPQSVQFSRGDILRRLGLTITKANYASLRQGFERLVGVRINAENSFWNARSSDFSQNVMFALLDEVRINSEMPGARSGQIPLALSSFKWSDVMHEQHLAGNVRSIHIAFALSLDLPLATRLFRYLDKHRFNGEEQRAKFEIELHRLCEIHLGMAKVKYVSKLKERLAPAHTELRNRGFLAGVEYEPMKSSPGEEKVVYYFAPPGSLVVDRALMQQMAAEESEVLNAPSTIEPDGNLILVDTTPTKPIPETSAVSKVRASAARCHAVFVGLPPEEQQALRERARQGVAAIFWDRLETPDSPMSLGLWDLVAQEYADEVEKMRIEEGA